MKPPATVDRSRNPCSCNPGVHRCERPPSDRRARAAFPLVLAGALLTLPGLAQTPLIEGVLQVRPGTLVSACGGIAFRCEAWGLSGTLTLASDPPRITASDLRVEPLATGASFAFPAQGDLALTELVEGDSGTSEIVLESPPGSLQTVDLRLSAFGGFGSEPDGLFLEGSYNEGCCDRFVIDFGLAPLLPVVVEGALTLQDGRFQVVAEFRTFEGVRGDATPVALDDQSGAFWFFEPDNPELFVKVLDGCEVNGRYWIFIAGLTNVEVSVAVFDQRNDYVPVYGNPLGRTFETVLDTEGFPCESVVPGG
ncbi:MAG TPA: hypothetical protein VMT85_06395 [Thermoanaerobaculia bacterium]|nr:hypothetical protein [Thermoanaerobaculia bacterium]